jgi:hypothetical protein
MARLANISGKDAVKAFKKFGWYTVGQVGSHVVKNRKGAGKFPPRKALTRLTNKGMCHTITMMNLVGSCRDIKEKIGDESIYKDRDI